MAQFEDLPVPQVVVETLEVVIAVPRERLPEHIVAQSVYSPLPQVVKRTLNEAVGELRTNKQRVKAVSKQRLWMGRDAEKAVVAGRRCGRGAKERGRGRGCAASQPSGEISKTSEIIRLTAWFQRYPRPETAATTVAATARIQIFSTRVAYFTTAWIVQPWKVQDQQGRKCKRPEAALTVSHQLFECRV